MSYKEVALTAVQLCGKGHLPDEAWKKAAAKIFPLSDSSQKKSCPRNAFLGLAGLGNITNLNQGNYTRSVDNKRYAETAVRILKANASKTFSAKELWEEVQKVLCITKKHNGQMDVVLALWENDLIK